MMDEGYRAKEVSWIRETCPQCLQALSTALFSNVIFFVYHKCFGFFLSWTCNCSDGLFGLMSNERNHCQKCRSYTSGRCTAQQIPIIWSRAVMLTLSPSCASRRRLISKFFNWKRSLLYFHKYVDDSLPCHCEPRFVNSWDTCIKQGICTWEV